MLRPAMAHGRVKCYAFCSIHSEFERIRSFILQQHNQEEIPLVNKCMIFLLAFLYCFPIVESAEKRDLAHSSLPTKPRYSEEPVTMETISSDTASAEEPTVATAEAKTLTRTPSTKKVYTVTKGLKNRQNSVLSAEVQQNAKPEENTQPEETREAESGASNTKTATSEEVKNANAILASAVAISSKGKEMPVTEIAVVEQRDGVEGSAHAIEKVLKDYGVPLPDDACWTTVNDEATKAWTAVNDETAKAWTAVNDETAKAWKTVESSKAYNEMSNHLTKFNESASQVYSQAVDGLTTAYVKAGEDLSLVGLALTQTQTVKSLNEFLGTDKTAETNKENEQDEEEAEDEGEGMEISLTNKIGDTKNLSEI